MGNIKKIVRCIRNNNPLNIRRGTARWKGMSKREDDEDFKNAVDRMFERLKKKNPNHFAVRQYSKFKLAAGVATCN